MESKYRHVKRACYVSSISISVTGILSPVFFLTFRDLYGIEYMDTEGIPLCCRLPSAVSVIIVEKFSALAAGQGTVDDCADKIQSRVSIWLAENAD